MNININGTHVIVGDELLSFNILVVLQKVSVKVITHMAHILWSHHRLKLSIWLIQIEANKNPLT